MTSKNNAPITNIDGTPMISDSGVDIKGNPFGITESSSSISTCDTDISSSFDSFDSCSSFDSDFDSGFDSDF
ncbi:hypothetical protein L2735_10405 [Shewanella olleyana]|uniref:hypothetical protein n=1 Tax=Shewanella olleyana TaxID=135626 RepID=UPI0020103212|nr:hypothetical protein [Shewanella olleyana]MCL1067218.1 hypothetical protein [Shewanella olleyana]